MKHHHTSIRTSDIFQSIAFYEALGFEVTERFTAGITLACWMQGAGTNLELMQVPEPKNTPDPFGDEHYVGYYHLSFYVENLQSFLQELVNKLGKVQLLLPPREQTIGDRTFQVAFLADPDGLPIELMEYGL
ncbi:MULTISPECIES: VOC family protein [Pseudanabaena]|uniref:Glyoxalase/bleomycin resistance protein/dioxygenase n=2 Tax=Pseudanabaena TaxID=1152 RepID=L8N277_9CYAN|nr:MULTISPECIES: VOC family protein [Pseudanabaena]ELS32840.1 Glyoxalase/bleomycin resistance protein/dioxygenase [Pseudanabaena biceps PCC 7429]MDG3494942.1 VOC family protein [Pseudanabaena catenata USMAC16]